MSEVDRLVALLELRGPLAYRGLPPAERAWRGRYALMVASLGASPAFAWASALAAVGDDETGALINGLDETPLLAALIFNGVDVEDLLLYD